MKRSARSWEPAKRPRRLTPSPGKQVLTDELETFTSVMTAVNKRIKGELSDDELDNIAGGMSVGAGIGITLGVAAAFGAAAA